jgi:hypothetical protein
MFARTYGKNMQERIEMIPRKSGLVANAQSWLLHGSYSVGTYKSLLAMCSNVPLRCKGDFRRCIFDIQKDALHVLGALLKEMLIS